MADIVESRAKPTYRLKAPKTPDANNTMMRAQLREPRRLLRRAGPHVRFQMIQQHSSLR